MFFFFWAFPTERESSRDKDGIPSGTFGLDSLLDLGSVIQDVLELLFCQGDSLLARLGVAVFVRVEFANVDQGHSFPCSNGQSLLGAQLKRESEDMCCMCVKYGSCVWEKWLHF